MGRGEQGALFESAPSRRVDPEEQLLDEKIAALAAALKGNHAHKVIDWAHSGLKGWTVRKTVYGRGEDVAFYKAPADNTQEVKRAHLAALQHAVELNS